MRTAADPGDGGVRCLAPMIQIIVSPKTASLESASLFVERQLAIGAIDVWGTVWTTPLADLAGG